MSAFPNPTGIVMVDKYKALAGDLRVWYQRPRLLSLRRTYRRLGTADSCRVDGAIPRSRCATSLIVNKAFTPSFGRLVKTAF